MECCTHLKRGIVVTNVGGHKYVHDMRCLIFEDGAGSGRGCVPVEAITARILKKRLVLTENCS
jgi:hypothetical protein